MPIEIKMPALSPTMEEGTLARWLVKEGDTVKAGDLLAEIETDKATMEFEAVDEGTIARIAVAEGTDGVKVGTVIATLAGEGEETNAAPTEAADAREPGEDQAANTYVPTADDSAASPPAGEERGVGHAPGMTSTARGAVDPALASSAAADGKGGGSGGDAESATSTSPGRNPPPQPSPARGEGAEGDRIKASPLARRIAAEKGVDLSALAGSGPNGRIVKADVEGAAPGTAVPQATQPVAAVAPAPVPSAAPTEPKAIWFDDGIPHTAEKLSNVRKTIARRLTEAKQTIPHIYLTVDVRLDALLKLRGELNAALAPRGVKLSVNDLLIKALGAALMQVPKCNVTFAGDQLISYSRADVSVAVSTPSGLITPIVRDVAGSSVSSIATRMKELAGRARENKLKPEEYQGGTASLSNMGMYGIKQFDAVINPPQGMILAVGAGEQRPHVIDGALGVATIMSATGSFDHRAIDGADGAELMQAFKALVEAPLGLVA